MFRIGTLRQRLLAGLTALAFSGAILAVSAAPASADPCTILRVGTWANDKYSDWLRLPTSGGSSQVFVEFHFQSGYTYQNSCGGPILNDERASSERHKYIYLDGSREIDDWEAAGSYVWSGQPPYGWNTYWGQDYWWGVHFPVYTVYTYAIN